MTRRPTAGSPTVFSFGPELPAEATTTAPASAALLAATASALFGSPDDPPKLMLITVATGLGNPSGSVGERASSSAVMMFTVPTQVNRVSQTL